MGVTPKLSHRYSFFWCAFALSHFNSCSHADVWMSIRDDSDRAAASVMCDLWLFPPQHGEDDGGGQQRRLLPGLLHASRAGALLGVGLRQSATREGTQNHRHGCTSRLCCWDYEYISFVILKLRSLVGCIKYIILMMTTMNNSNHYDCYCCYYERFDVEKMSATELSLCSLKSFSHRLVATPPVGFWLRPLGQPFFCALKSPALHR